MSPIGVKNRLVLVSLSFLLGGIAAGGGYVALGKPLNAGVARSNALRVASSSVGGGAGLYGNATSGATMTVPPAWTAPGSPASSTPTDTTPTGSSPASPSAAHDSMTAAPPASQPVGGSFAEQVVALVNRERVAAGCGPVTEDSHLDAAAQAHSDDMSARAYFSHTTPEGFTVDQRIHAAGYGRSGAENIAKGSQTAEETMRLWMDSPGHRANIVDCQLTRLGVGVSKQGWYWTQDFGL